MAPLLPPRRHADDDQNRDRRAARCWEVHAGYPPRQRARDRARPPRCALLEARLAPHATGRMGGEASRPTCTAKLDRRRRFHGLNGGTVLRRRYGPHRRPWAVRVHAAGDPTQTRVLRETRAGDGERLAAALRPSILSLDLA